MDRVDTLTLTQEFNNKYFNEVKMRIDTSQFSIMKDDIKNYRALTEFQLDYLKNLNENEKIEIIKLYDVMMGTIESILK